jgi:hypothetical protein
VITETFDVTVPWYRETLGLLCSDNVYRGTTDHLVGSFNRIDRGDEYVDHHVIYFMRGTPSGLNHLAFEVPDIDDVHVGHEHLVQKGYRSTWGVGRHALGSQVFDYWFDPWGRVHEHTGYLEAATAPPGRYGCDEMGFVGRAAHVFNHAEPEEYPLGSKGAAAIGAEIKSAKPFLKGPQLWLRPLIHPLGERLEGK